MHREGLQMKGGSACTTGFVPVSEAHYSRGETVVRPH